MADNVPITAGVGTSIATDDVSDVHYQRVKLVDGTLDSTAAIGGDATNGLDVDVTRMPPNVTATGTLDAPAEEVLCTLPNGCATVSTQVTGTYTGQLEFEGTVDGTNYASVQASNGTQTVNATTGTGIFILPGSGYVKVRVRASALSAGAAVVTMVASIGTTASIQTGSTPQGTNLIGKVGIDQVTANANEIVVKSGTVTTVSTVTAVTKVNEVVPGVAATDLGKAIDTALGATDTGVLALAVRDDTLNIRSGTENDVEPLHTDAVGALWVRPMSVAAPVATELAKAEDAGHTTGDIGVMALAVRNTGHAALTNTTLDYSPIAVDAEGCVMVVGNVAHDAQDVDPPIKIGAKAITLGTTPTSVATADRTDLYATRGGVLFVIGGNPNVITLEATYTAAQTDTAIVTVAAGTKIVVTQIQCVVSNATTTTPAVRVGFGTANTPTTTGVVLTHGGIPGGGGVSRGDGGGLIGIGADNEDLRITCEAPTGGDLRVLVTYYTTAA